MSTTAVSNAPDLPQVMDATLAILKSRPGQPILMSALGLRLARQFSGPGLREALQGKKLRDVMTSSLGPSVVFEGTAQTLFVRLNEQVTPEATRFDPAAWAAFAKPIFGDKLRFIKLEKPIDFKDLERTADAPAGWFQIEASAIPSTELAKPERDAAISSALYAFAESVGVPVSQLLETRTPKASPTTRALHNALPSTGAAAILQLIEAIPPSERGAYHLPLDLVHRLLKN